MNDTVKTIIVKIYGDIFTIKTTTDSNKENHIKNIVTRTLAKRKIDLKQILLENGTVFKKCNCGNVAQYTLDYDIQHVNDILYFTINGIKYDHYAEYEKLWCGNCLKGLNSNSIERVCKMYNVNREIANKIILERNTSPFYATNHNSEKEYKEYQKRDESWYKNRYGEDGEKIFKQNIKKFYQGSLKDTYKKDSISLAFFIKKFDGDIEKAKIARKERIKTIAFTLENCVLKHGKTLGAKKYFEKIKTVAYKNSIGYYIEKHGELEGRKRYDEFKNKCTCSLENFVKWYGVEIGEEKYKTWLIGICSAGRRCYSKDSEIFFNRLQQYLGNIEIIHGKTERFIYDKIGYRNQHIFFYDAYVKKYNMLIEYDTPMFHSNPEYLTSDEINSFYKKQFYTYDYGKDKFKENLALSLGYKFYRVFIKKDKDKTIELEKLINYIQNTYGD